MSAPRILVAGAGGFIGGHLLTRLTLDGARVRAVDIKPIEDWYQSSSGVECVRLDLSRREACEQAVEGVSEVYNLAADMGGMGFIECNKALCMLTVLINTHLLLASSAARVRRYFYASSACVYNVAKQQSHAATSLREEDAYPAMPEDGYGWEKLFSERMCRHFNEDLGLATRVARYHNVYGPHGTWDGGREKAPAALCRKVIEAVDQGAGEIEVWGDGKQTRSFMYIDDCISGTLRLMKSDVDEPINLGSEEVVTIDGLLDLVEGLAGAKLARRYLPDAPRGVNGRNSDNSRLRRDLGWEPAVRLRDGLKRTYSWILQEYLARKRADGRAHPSDSHQKSVENTCHM
jgi:GDP-D-mannose 3', 5'-epimerase